MRKVLLLAIAAAGGLLVWLRVTDDRADRDLWAEVTDPVE